MDWLVCSGAEEFVFAFGVFKNFNWWHAEDLHDQGQLLSFTLSRKDWYTCVELDQYAPKAPHIDGSGIWNTNNDLGCSVEARLDVRVNSLVGEARGSKVNNLDAGLVRTLEEYVLWL